MFADQNMLRVHAHRTHYLEEPASGTTADLRARIAEYRRSGMALPILILAGQPLNGWRWSELFRHLFHRAPVHARMPVYVFDELL